MSQFCFAVLSEFKDKEAVADCKNAVLSFAKSKQIGLQFDGFYMERFLREMSAGCSCVICNLSDGENTINCEALLCPDYCNIEEASARRPLFERLTIIEQLIQCALFYADRCDVIIGESGDDLDEYDTTCCTDSQICETLLNAYAREGDGMIHNVRFIVQKRRVLA